MKMREVKKIFTEEEMRYAAGHPNAIPKICIDYFVMGAEWMQRQLLEKENLSNSEQKAQECDARGAK